MDGLSFFLGWLAAVVIRAVIDVARKRSAESKRRERLTMYADMVGRGRISFDEARRG